MCEAPEESGELTLSATLTQTWTRAFGEFWLKLYTDTESTDTEHTPVCNVSVQTKLKCECEAIFVLLLQ